MKRLMTIALVSAMAAVFAAPAMANEWNLYGSARVATFYTQRDYGDIFTDVDNPGGDDIFGKDNFKNTQWALQSNSRVGATVKGDMLRRPIRVWCERRQCEHPPALRRVEVHGRLGSKGWSGLHPDHLLSLRRGVRL